MINLFCGIDYDILKFLQEIRIESLNKIFGLFTFFGEGPFAFIVIMVFYFSYNKELGEKMLYVYSSGTVFNDVIKNFVCRARPFKKFEGDLTCLKESTATGYSFPSGHSESVASLTFGISYYYKKNWGYFVSLLLTALVGFSRAYFGAHYVSDIIVGIAIGIIWTIIMSNVYDRVNNKGYLYLITCSVFFLLGVIFIFRKDINFADFYKKFGLLIGCGFGTYVERKHVNFETYEKLGSKIGRAIFCILPAAAVYFGLKELIDPLKDIAATIPNKAIDYCLLSLLRYFLMAFTGLGLMPLLYKRIIQKNKKQAKNSKK